MGAHPAGRDNGLPRADSYVALVDVDPPVADHVLELLGAAGVAAVAEPLGKQVDPYREVRAVRLPTERVHVDGSRAARARELVATALPALRNDFHADAARRIDAAVMRDSEVSAAFEQLVAGYDNDPQSPVGPWPVQEDRDPAASGPRLSNRLVRRASDEEDPDPSYWPDDHYTPPTPPPIPRPRPATAVAWCGLVGGPLLLLLSVIFGIDISPWVAFIAVAGFIVGFASLVFRLPERHEDSWDDGAVV